MNENLPDTNVGNIKYINKQVAIDVLDKEYRYGADIDRCGLSTALDYIEFLEPADVAPVVHAHWKDNKNGTVSCSRCSTWFQKERVPYLRFCGYCGARMDGKGEE